MRRIGRFDFPDNPVEAQEWRPYIRRIALSRSVLVVATTRIEGMWKAYCDSVAGQNHDDEWQEVLRVGSPMLKEWAEAMFHDFKDVPYAR